MTAAALTAALAVRKVIISIKNRESKAGRDRAR